MTDLANFLLRLAHQHLGDYAWAQMSDKQRKQAAIEIWKTHYYHD